VETVGLYHCRTLQFFMTKRKSQWSSKDVIQQNMRKSAVSAQRLWCEGSDGRPIECFEWVQIPQEKGNDFLGESSERRKKMGDSFCRNLPCTTADPEPRDLVVRLHLRLRSCFTLQCLYECITPERLGKCIALQRLGIRIALQRLHKCITL
jgi:hypothetical protein